MINLKHFAKTLLLHPSFLNLFILPVFIPLRLLGNDIPTYHYVIPEGIDRLYYFLQVSVIISIISISLSMLTILAYRSFSSSYGHHEYQKIIRVLSIFIALLFIFSTYNILNPSSIVSIYIWTGIHFFCIAFYRNLLEVESKTFRMGMKLTKNKALALQLSNNLIGFNLNLLAIPALIIFYFFRNYISIEWYAVFCVVLEISLLFYLLFCRGYISDIKQLPKIGYLPFMKVLGIYFFGALLAVSFSILFKFYMIIIIILMLMGAIVYLFLIRKTLQMTDMMMLINTGFNYGLVLAVLSSSILLFLMAGDRDMIMYFGKLVTLEPLLSLIISLSILFFILKNKLNQARTSFYAYSYYTNFLLAFFLLAVYLVYQQQYVIIAIPIILISYSFIEYINQFSNRQVILQEYSTTHSSAFLYISVVLNQGIVPLMLLSILYVLNAFTDYSIEYKIMIAIMIVASVALLFNLFFGRLRKR